MKGVPKTMRAVCVTGYTGYYPGNGLPFDSSFITVQKDTPTPKCGPNEVLINVKASSVNPVDWKLCSGELKERYPIRENHIPGFDMSGVVVYVGKDCSRIKVGDEVWACHQYTYAEFCSAPEARVGLKPTNLSFAEAAVAPAAAMSSLEAMHRGKVGHGSRVLILGGSGGCGSLGVQIASAKGAKVYATCSTKNVETVLGFGADKIIDYTKEEWSDVLHCGGMDCVYDTVGPAAGETKVLEKMLKVFKPGGRFVSISTKVPPRLTLENKLTAEWFQVNKDNLEGLNELKELFQSGKVRCPIARQFSLEQIAEAFQMSMSGRTVGKICIEVTPCS